MRISDWSSDVCSSDLVRPCREEIPAKRIAGIPVQPRCPALQQPFARAEANIGDEILAQEGADRIGSADGAEQLVIGGVVALLHRAIEKATQRRAVSVSIHQDRKSTRLNSSH